MVIQYTDPVFNLTFSSTCPSSALSFQVAALLDALSTVHSYQSKKARGAQRLKHKDFLQQREKQEGEKVKRQKEAKKKLYRMMGQQENKSQRSSLKGASQDG